MRFLSPLRYPGGKGALAPFLTQLISAQRPRIRTYVEPFAGGAGAALRLLRDEIVEDIVINDLNPGVAAFWRALLEHTDDLVAQVQKCAVTLKQWHKHRATYEASAGDDLTLGFATFFLNRTNRSGILGARPIGGLEQTGTWKIDARFNRDDLCHRMREIARYRGRITVTQCDATELLVDPTDERTFLYVDPPYLAQGDDLYLDTLKWSDHQRVAERLISNHPRWLVTYDADLRVPHDLYPSHRTGWFDIKHTAARQHVGREFVVFSRSLRVENLVGLSVNEAGWHKTRSSSRRASVASD